MDKDDKAVSNVVGLEDKGFQSQLEKNLEEAKRDVESDKELNCLGESATILVNLLCRYYKRMNAADSSSRKILAEVGKYLVQNCAVDVFKVYFDIYLDENSKKEWKTLERLLLVCLKFSDSSVEFSEKITESGILLNMIAFLKKYKESFPQKLETEGIIVRWSAGILYNCSISSNNKMFFNDLNAVELISWYAKNARKISKEDNNLLTSFCMLTLAHINDEENSDLILAGDEIISYIIKYLQHQIQCNHPEGFSALELSLGLTKLANNDKNSIKIVQRGALSSLMKLIRKGNVDEQIAAVNCIWALSFVEENNAIIKSKTEVMKKLKELEGHDSSKLQHAASGTLWVLRSLTPNQNESKHLLQRGEEKHVMLSYNWDNQCVAILIRDRLRASGYSVWLDAYNMNGNIFDAMAEAVEQSAVVIICMSQKYQDSQNCKMEASYAVELRKDIIPLRLQKGFVPNRWLGLITTGKLYIDFSDLSVLDNSMTKLIREIGDRSKING